MSQQPSTAPAVNACEVSANCLAHVPSHLDAAHKHGHAIYDQYYQRVVQPNKEIRYDKRTLLQRSCVLCRCCLIFDYNGVHYDMLADHFSHGHQTVVIEEIPVLNYPITLKKITEWNDDLLEFKLAEYTSKKGYTAVETLPAYPDLFEDPTYHFKTIEDPALQQGATTTSPTPANSDSTAAAPQQDPLTDVTPKPMNPQGNVRRSARNADTPAQRYFQEEESEEEDGEHAPTAPSRSRQRKPAAATTTTTPATTTTTTNSMDMTDGPPAKLIPLHSGGRVGAPTQGITSFLLGRDKFLKRTRHNDRACFQCLYCNTIITQSSSLLDHLEHHLKFFQLYWVTIPQSLTALYGNVTLDETTNTTVLTGGSDPTHVLDVSKETPDNTITINVRKSFLLNNTCAECHRCITAPAGHYKRTHTAGQAVDLPARNQQELNAMIARDTAWAKQHFGGCHVVVNWIPENDSVQDSTQNPLYLNNDNVGSTATLLIGENDSVLVQGESNLNPFNAAEFIKKRARPGGGAAAGGGVKRGAGAMGDEESDEEGVKRQKPNFGPTGSRRSARNLRNEMDDGDYVALEDGQYDAGEVFLAKDGTAIASLTNYLPTMQSIAAEREGTSTRRERDRERERERNANNNKENNAAATTTTTTSSADHTTKQHTAEQQQHTSQQYSNLAHQHALLQARVTELEKKCLRFEAFYNQFQTFFQHK